MTSKRLLRQIFLCLGVALFSFLSLPPAWATPPLDSAANETTDPSFLHQAAALNDDETHVDLTEEEIKWIADHPDITLGFTVHYMPMVIVDQEGRLYGFIPDYLKLINQKLGMNIRLVLTDSASDMVELIKNKSIDGMPACRPLKEWNRLLDFSQPYMKSYLYMYTRSENANRYRRLTSLRGKRVGYLNREIQVKNLLATQKDLNIIPLQSMEAMAEALLGDEVDAVIGSVSLEFWRQQTNHTGFKVTAVIPNSESDVVFATRKDWPELVTLLNKGMAAISMAEKQRLFSLWFGLTPTSEEIPTALTGTEKAWLKAHPVIRVGADPHWEPVEYVDERGHFQGISADYLKRLGEILGVRFEVATKLSWQEALEAGKQGRLDMFSSMRKTPERATYLEFTDTFISMPIVIFSGPDLAYVGNMKELAYKKVAIIDGYAIHELLRKNHPNIQLVPCANIIEAINRLTRGEVSAYIGNILTTSHYLAGHHISRIRVVGKTPYSYDQAMAVTKQNAILRDILQKALLTIPESEHTAIYQRWVSIRHYQWFNYNLLWKVGGIALLVILIVLALNRRLSSEVKKRTRELNAANELLTESEERYRQTFQNNAAVKLLIDPDTGDILDANHAACAFYRYPIERLLALKVQDIHTLPPATLKQQLIKIKHQKSGYFTTKHKLATGDIRDVEIYTGPISIRGKTILFSIIHDISIRKELEERLQQAHKMKAIGTLAGGIANDFNNLLSPIIAMAEHLVEKLPPDNSAHHDVREIMNTGIQARALVKQILAFSRQTENWNMPVSFSSVLKDVINQVRSTLPAHITIIQDIRDNGCFILADPEKIHHLCMHLMVNACQAIMPNSGEITITLKKAELTETNGSNASLKPGNYTILTIDDTGCGIDPSIREKIFAPYFTTKKEEKATGLGLSMVYGIVKEYQGDIDIVSEVGKGTSCRVYLPSIKEMAPEDIDSMAGHLPVGHEHILLVDDEKDLVAYKTQMLEHLGYRITSRTNSLDALDDVRNTPDLFDLVITAMAMPGMAGDALTASLIEIRPDLPVIICAGFSDRINRQKAATIGAKGLLMKPVVLSELARMVRAVLDGSYHETD